MGGLNPHERRKYTNKQTNKQTNTVERVRMTKICSTETNQREECTSQRIMKKPDRCRGIKNNQEGITNEEITNRKNECGLEVKPQYSM